MRGCIAITDLTNIFKPSNNYIDETLKFNKIDMFLALLLVIIQWIIYWCLGRISVQKADSMTELFNFTITGISSVIIVLTVMLFCKVRKQKITSLGLNRTNAKKALRLGLVLSILWAILAYTVNSKSGLIVHREIRVETMILRIIYIMFFISFMEEITIRAYVGIRIYAFLKNNVLSVLSTGFIWALLHIPYFAATKRIGIIEYMFSGSWNFLNYILLHMFFNFLYSKHNNIIGVTIVHFTLDFIPWLWVSRV